MEVTVNDSIANIAPEAWNALAGAAWPFLKHEFLLAAETSGSVTPDAGWAPRHLAIYDGDALRAAMPLYQKDHSWGEFVFDWAWARAYEQAGLPYYPKLVSAVPFTPAPSRRLLLADRGDTEGAIALVHGAVTLANQTHCSSVHLLFPAPEEVDVFREAGLHIRKDCQFHWHNDGYADFDEFLATFNSAKRKKARRDRRKVQEAGIRFRRLRGADLTAETWDEVYRLISITFMRRGSLPYFTLDFFRKISAALPDGILVVLAEKEDTPVAAAVFFVGEQALYGRYWGSDGHYDALHFETCYHQGIEYCIDHGLRLFEPGTQGEHKVARGFVPTATWSAHWLKHPEFFAVIGDYLERERQHVERYMDAVDERSPYKSRDPT